MSDWGKIGELGLSNLKVIWSYSCVIWYLAVAFAVVSKAQAPLISMDKCLGRASFCAAESSTLLELSGRGEIQKNPSLPSPILSWLQARWELTGVMEDVLLDGATWTAWPLLISQKLEKRKRDERNCRGSCVLVYERKHSHQGGRRCAGLSVQCKRTRKAVFQCDTCTCSEYRVDPSRTHF